ASLKLSSNPEIFFSTTRLNAEQRPPNHLLQTTLHRRLAFRRNRCSTKEVRIIDTQKTTST
ncbi:hypothetical protein, partial [Thauera sp.]|uniref:hypothetical protein n=1 Tax=Thauera sp. TaxID=1905334 RepID=UPI00261F504A